MTTTPTNDRLDHFRQIGDRILDDCMVAFSPDITDPNELMGAVARAMHGSQCPEGPIGDWLMTPRPLPDWADANLILEGQKVFQRWGLQIGAVLFTASLPWAYAAEFGVQPLARSSDLMGRDVRRRISETGQMLVDVGSLSSASGDTFDCESQAYQTVSSVRVLHAAVRRALLASADWNPAWGLPINQEDMAGALLTFTTLIFDGLHRLGISLRPEEEVAYLHLWSIVGHHLGIDHELIDQDPARARSRQIDIASRHQRPSPEGVRLMAVLLREMEVSMPRGLRKVPRTYVRQIAGAKVADILEVPAPAWWAPVLTPTAAIGRLATRLPPVRRLAGWPGRVIASAMFRMYIDDGLADGRPRFRIDAELARQWRLGTGERRRAWRLRRVAAHRSALPGVAA